MIFLYNRQLKSVPASTYVRFEEKEKLEINSPSNGTIPKLPIDLVTAQQDNKWQLDNWGILGLSPKGSFLTYLKKAYVDSESISLALKHTLTEVEAENDLMRFQVQAYLNPLKEKHYKDEDVFGTYPIDSADDFWYLKGGIALGDTQFKYDDQKICLSTLGNELFGVIDSLVWCDQVNSRVYIELESYFMSIILRG